MYQTTATHQLKTAMMSVAFAGRSILQSSMSTAKQELGGDMDDRMFLGLIGISLSNALLGMDANDPPKTLATMQLIGSIFSNVRSFNLENLPNINCSKRFVFFLIGFYSCIL